MESIKILNIQTGNVAESTKLSSIKYWIENIKKEFPIYSNHQFIILTEDVDYDYNYMNGYEIKTIMKDGKEYPTNDYIEKFKESQFENLYNKTLKEFLINAVNTNMSNEDLMDYVEDDLAKIIYNIIFEIQTLSNDSIDLLDINIKAEEISDGKYEIIAENSNDIKSQQSNAWDTKENFVETLYQILKI